MSVKKFEIWRPCLWDPPFWNLKYCLSFMFTVELDRYIGQPIYIGRYQGQADISNRCLPPIKYRLRTIRPTLNCLFLRASSTALAYDCQIVVFFVCFFIEQYWSVACVCNSLSLDGD